MRQRQQQQPSSLWSAGQLVLALPALFAFLCVLSFLSLLFCFVFLLLLGDSACEALSQSALPSPHPACLYAHSLSLSPSLSLLLSLVPLPFCLRASTVRLFVASVCCGMPGLAAAAQSPRSSSTVGQQASSVSQSVANAAGARISTRPHRPRCPSSQSQLTHFARFSHVNFNCLCTNLSKC